MSKQLSINVTNILVTSRSAEVKIDLLKLSDDILRSLLSHGVTQKVADAASQAAGAACESHFGTADYNKADAKAWLESDGGKAKVRETTQAMMQKAVDALERGEWSMRQAGGTRLEADPVTKLTHDKAKATLLAMFKAAAKGKATKIADLAALSPKIAAFFTDKAKWDERAVAAYVQKQRETDGGRDFRAEAVAELNAIAEAVDEVNVDDLLGDLLP